MSDVEKILAVNQERRRWAEEVDAGMQPQKETTGAKKHTRADRMEAMKTACWACAMASGAGAAMLGIGIASHHAPTIIIGAVVALSFLLTGWAIED